jgi:N-methylhydantoinase B/oxoprolinase/acetone carboxylase alpha subunit
VITPVYRDGRPVFYVASRGHHADIGGITPGSMPPFSKFLVEEGACFKSFKLVQNGHFQVRSPPPPPRDWVRTTKHLTFGRKRA